MLLQELYQEHKGSSFTHMGKKYDLNKVLQLVEHFPIVEVDVDDLVWVLEHDEPDFDRVADADLTAPILVAVLKDDGALVPVDGLHRVEKARRQRVKQLPAQIVTDDVLEQSKMEG